MQTLALLDTAIGLVLIYAIYSVACTAIVEWISGVWAMRALLLRQSISDLLGCTTLVQDFEAHQMIKGLKTERLLRGPTFPDYIPNETFALAFMSLTLDFTPGAPGAPGSVKVKPGLQVVAHQLAASLMQGTNNVGPVQARIEKWFSDAMESASGRYKRKTQIISILAAIVVTAAFNLNTVFIVQQLYGSAPLRSNLAQAAQAGIVDKTGKIGNFSALELPIGGQAPMGGKFVADWAGYGLSIVALSFGAPFWFDLLKQLVNIRQASRPPDEQRPSA